MRLKENYIDEILQDGEQRKYNLIGDNGSTLYSNVRLEKAYTPKQHGTKFSAEDVNSITKAVNNATDNIVNIANETHYARKETKTGDTWIDGKPIYVKIIEWTGLSSGTGSKPCNISNADTYVDLRVYAKQPSTKSLHKFPVVYYQQGTSGTFYVTNFGLSGDDILYQNNTSWAGYEFKAFVYYTKTTA